MIPPEIRALDKVFHRGDKVVVVERLHPMASLTIVRTPKGYVELYDKDTHMPVPELSKELKTGLWESFKAALGMEPSYHLHRSVSWQIARPLIRLLEHWPKSGLEEIRIDIKLVSAVYYGLLYDSPFVTGVWINGSEKPYGSFFFPWEPILYEGPYSARKIIPLNSGPETLSGKGTHPRAGITVRSSNGNSVYLCNPKFIPIRRPS